MQRRTLSGIGSAVVWKGCLALTNTGGVVGDELQRQWSRAADQGSTSNCYGVTNELDCYAVTG